MLLAFALVAAACSGSAVSTTAPSPTDRSVAPTTTAPPPPTTISGPVATTTSSPVPVPTSNAPTGPVRSQPIGIGDEYYPGLGNPGYDVQHYGIELTFDPIENYLTATATITAIATTELRTFNLDFDRLTVDALRVNGEPAEYVHVDEEITILVAVPIAQGAEFAVEVEYSGNPGPEPTDALPFDIGWFTSVDGSEAFVVAEPDNAHTWFPSNDHPLDKATFDILITVPEELTAAANGVLVAVESDDYGTATWWWETDDPMATYLATIVIGEFDIVRDDDASRDAGIPIRHVLPRGTRVSDWPGLERQGEMVAFLQDLFGPYPFNNYGIAIVEGFPNALETQTLSIIGRQLTDPELFERVLIHELAHQWFGDSVSIGLWRDIWLAEGFASYAEWLWIERERGRELVDSSIEAERAFFADSGVRPPGDPLADDLFNQSVYRVGAMTLHALRLTVGDLLFFEVLRIYHQQFAGGTATTGDFIDVAEDVSGMDLGDLFESWLFEAEVPEFP